MKKTKKEPIVLNLLVDSAGKVWTASGPTSIWQTEKPIKEVLDIIRNRPQYRRYTHYCTLGCHSQADLIFGLNYMLRSGHISSLSLCGAFTEHGPINPEKDPVKAINRMTHQALPPSIGGFHEINQSDLFVLSAKKAYDEAKNTDVIPDSVAQSVKTHPAYKHLKFIAGISDNQIAKLFVRIFDPRFHISGEDHAYQSLVQLYRSESKNEKYNSFLKFCWCHDTNDDKAGNRNFLYRLFRKIASLSNEDIAINEVNNAFLAYLALGWVSCVSVSHRGRLFVPEFYFSTMFKKERAEAVVLDYKKFMTAS